MRLHAIITLLTLLLRIPAGMAQDDAPSVKLFTPHAAVQMVDSPDTALQNAPQVRRDGQLTLNAEPGVQQVMEDFSNRRQPMRGYRVQVFLGADRKTAEQVRRDLLKKHDDLPAYLSYLAPNFRVRVGDLREKTDAERLRQRLRADHPGCYIVEDDIEMPLLPLIDGGVE
jgi:hypothetical protein